MKKLTSITEKIFAFLSTHSLIISIIITVILFGVFYPTYFGTNDEHCYLRNAWNLTREGLLFEDYGESLKQSDYGNGYTTKCILGTSFVLIPFTYLGWQATFVATLLIFILSILIFNKLLQHFKLNPFFLYLYAFFPPFIYYQRTLFTEPYSLTFTLLGFYIFIKAKNYKYYFLSAVIFGAAIFIRYTQILPISLFGIYLLFETVKNYKNSHFKKSIINLFVFTAGFIPYLPIILYINNALWGGPFASGYDFNSNDYEIALSLSVVPFMFIRYFVVLNILYPFMWILSLFGRTKKDLLLTILPANLLILFYLTFRLYVWENRPLDLILGIRYLIPIIPFILISYFAFLNKYIANIIVKMGLIVLLILLIITSIGIHTIHQSKFISIKREIMEDIKTTVPDDAFIIGEYDDFIYLMEPYNDKYYEDVFDIDKLEDSKSNLISQKEIYVITINDPNKSGRPSIEMVKFFEQYKENLSLVTEKKYISIYRLNNE